MELETKVLNAIQDLRNTYEQNIEKVHGRIDELLAKNNKPGDTGGRHSDALEEVCNLIVASKADLKRYGTVAFTTKAPLTGNANVYANSFDGTIVEGGRFPHRLRFVIPNVPVQGGMILALAEGAITNNAAIVGQGNTKPTTDVTLTGTSVEPWTVAHLCHASEQIIDDIPAMEAFLKRMMIFSLYAKVEDLILNDSTQGFIPSCNAVTGNTTNVSNLDRVSMAVEEVWTGGFKPSHVVLNPTTLMGIMRSKANTAGTYMVGSPTEWPDPMRLWGCELVLSDKIASNTALAFDQSAVSLRVRQEVQWRFSYSHDQNFAKNLLSFRAEERLIPIVHQATGLKKVAMA